MKEFKLKDATPHGSVVAALSLTTIRGDLVDSPLDWQRLGLQQTATGYGAKLTTCWKIHFEGKLRRIYATCYGNAASCWFTFKGQRVFVH